MFRSRQFLIGIVVSLLFLGWALWQEDLGRVWDAILRANFWALLPALGLYFIGVWMRALRWRILLKPIVPRTTAFKTFEVVVIGYMANDVLPARIGELVRAYVLSRREGVRKTATLATILVERIFDGLTMIGFAAAAIAFIVLFDPVALSTGEGHALGTLLTWLNVPIAIGAVAFLGLLFAFGVVASSRKRVEQLVRLGLRFLPGRYRPRGERLAGSFLDGLGSLRRPSSLAAVLGLSIIAWLFETGMYYVIGRWGFDLRLATGAELPFYAYMLATAFVNLGTLIPQAPGFLGVFDFIGKWVLVGAFGVASGPAISYVLVLHATLLLPVTLLGFVYLWRESLSWHDLTGLEVTRATASAEAHELEGPLTDIELVQDGKITAGEAETLLERAGEADPRGGVTARPPSGDGTLPQAPRAGREAEQQAPRVEDPAKPSSHTAT